MSLMPRLHVLADSRRRRWRAPSGPEAYGEYFWRRFLEVVVVLKIEPRNLFHIATRVSKFDLIHASAGLIAHGHRRSCLRRPSAPPEVDSRIAVAHSKSSHVKSRHVKSSQVKHSIQQSVSQFPRSNSYNTIKRAYTGVRVADHSGPRVT